VWRRTDGVQYCSMSPASGQGIQYERFQGDLNDPDRATAETVACMCKYIADAQSDSGVQAAAKQAQRWGNPVAGAFWWPKHYIKFVQDDVLVSQLLNENDQLELLVTPPVMVRSSKPRGDCDDFTMMVCALLKLLGTGFEIVTVAADGQDPSRFSHVFCRAVLSDGTRIPLDASHGKYPGWCVPASRTYRIQVWDENGSPIKDAGSKWNGLHGIVAGRGVQGLGCDAGMVDDGEGGCIFDTSITTGGGDGTTPYVPIGPPSLQPNTCPSGLVLVSGECVIPGTTVSTSTAGGANTTPGAGFALPGGAANSLSSILASVFGTGSQIAGAALKPTVPPGSIAINTNSLLLYGGLAVLGVLFVAMVSKK
jgi:hypothetical protein